MNRFVGPILALVLLVAVGAGIYMSASDAWQQSKAVSVTGLSGSEKIPFFSDPRVIELLASKGFEVHLQKAGSRQIATSFDLNKFDFAFPAGVPAAEKIRREVKSSKSFQVFFTPIVIATWEPIVSILEANDLVERRSDYWGFDTGKYQQVVASEVRWNDLQDNSDYAVNKSVLLTSTDVRKSNSAAMYLSLMSYVANGNSIVKNEAEARKVLPFVKGLFLKQGYVESSSQTPFDDYLVMGMGKSPMVIAYESQFIYSATPDAGGVPGQAVLMYPEPTIYTKHIFIGLTDAGKQLGQLLDTDEELRKLAIEHGFRNQNRGYFKEFTESLGIDLPGTLVNVIEPPSYEVTETMIQAIERAYQGG